MVSVGRARLDEVRGRLDVLVEVRTVMGWSGDQRAEFDRLCEIEQSLLESVHADDAYPIGPPN
jgi:hypothetical protein